MRFHLVRGFLRGHLTPSSGMTLIELLVVIVIAGILAAISLPAFLNRANAAKQTEAKTLISALNRAQQAYFMEHARFTAEADDLFIKVQNGKYYNYTITIDPGKPQVEHHASPKSIHYKIRAYVGMLAIIALPTSEVISQSVLCESNDFVEKAATPTYNGMTHSIDCANGTRDLN